MSTPLDIDAYRQSVESLKAQEAALRYDHDALLHMTEDEARANAIFTRLRDAEVQARWEKEGDLDNFAGMDFYGHDRMDLAHMSPRRFGMPSTACPRARYCIATLTALSTRASCSSTRATRPTWQ